MQVWAATSVQSEPTELQQDVSQALALAGVPNRVGWLTDDGHFSLHIAFELNGTPTAVEVNEPREHSANAPALPLADVVVRHRLIQSRGWHVVPVSRQLWDSLPGGLAAKGTALLQLLGASVGHTEWQWVGPPRRRQQQGQVSDALAGSMEAAKQQAAWEVLRAATLPDVRRSERDAADVCAGGCRDGCPHVAAGGGAFDLRTRPQLQGTQGLGALGDPEVTLAAAGAGGRGITQGLRLSASEWFDAWQAAWVQPPTPVLAAETVNGVHDTPLQHQHP